MSKSTNLAAIGVFVVVGTILTLGGILALASGILFSPKLHVVTFFNESVAGLNVGAPTKFQGVIIGKVTRISFWPQPDTTQSYIRVEAEIDVALTLSLGATRNFSHADQMEKSVREGLRTNLATESMVTGIRYIEIQYDFSASEPIFLNTEDGFIEVPSTPSALAGLTASVSEIVARVGAVDLPALTGDLRDLLEIQAEALDIKALNDQTLATLKAAEDMMSNKEITNSLKSLDNTLAALRDLATTINNESQPMMARLDSAAVALVATLQASQVLLEHAGSLMAPEGSFRYETETAMREMGAMARALRLLADELERNPGSLVRGKAEK